MHELSITQGILNLTLEHANKAGASKVTSINLVIGRLSSLVDDSISFYWDTISEDTICAGAKLVFDRRQAVLKCNDCQQEYTIEQDLQPCPNCKSYNIVIVKGEEFYLDSIEIEKEEN